MIDPRDLEIEDGWNEWVEETTNGWVAVVCINGHFGKAFFGHPSGWSEDGAFQAARQAVASHLDTMYGR